MRPSHRFVCVHFRRDSRWRIELRRRAINGSRFANSLRFAGISRRIPARAIAQRMRIGLRHFVVHACCNSDHLCVLARGAVQFPKSLTMAPVNPHLDEADAASRYRLHRCAERMCSAGARRWLPYWCCRPMMRALTWVEQSAVRHRQPHALRLCLGFASIGVWPARAACRSGRLSLPQGADVTVRHLDALFQPKSVAVVGASSRAAVSARWCGRACSTVDSRPVWPVNPKYRELHGHPVVADVDRLPAPPSVAVICTPPAPASCASSASSARALR